MNWSILQIPVTTEPNIIDIVNTFASLGMFGALMLGGLVIYLISKKSNGQTSKVVQDVGINLIEMSKLLTQMVDHSAKGATDHAEIVAILKLQQASLDVLVKARETK